MKALSDYVVTYYSSPVASHFHPASLMVLLRPAPVSVALSDIVFSQHTSKRKPKFFHTYKDVKENQKTFHLKTAIV